MLKQGRGLTRNGFIIVRVCYQGATLRISVFIVLHLSTCMPVLPLLIILLLLLLINLITIKVFLLTIHQVPFMVPYWRWEPILGRNLPLHSKNCQLLGDSITC